MRYKEHVFATDSNDITINILHLNDDAVHNNIIGNYSKHFQCVYRDYIIITL